MANPVKKYFLAPSWDNPPDGLIQLGNIITSPSRATQPLNTRTRKPPAQNELFVTDKSGVIWTKEKQREGRYGVWTTFLSVLGLGVDASANHDRALEDHYSFDRMDTVEFLPSDAYLAESLKNLAVASYLEKSRFKKSVYMITGIKTVTGAKAKSFQSHGGGGALKVALGGTLIGSPVSLGPEMSATWQTEEEHSFDGSSEFVFAFRISKIKVHHNDEITHDQFTKGALFDADKVMSIGPTSLIVADMEEWDDPVANDDCIELRKVLEDGHIIQIYRI